MAKIESNMRHNSQELVSRLMQLHKLLAISREDEAKQPGTHHYMAWPAEYDRAVVDFILVYMMMLEDEADKLAPPRPPEGYG